MATEYSIPRVNPDNKRVDELPTPPPLPTADQAQAGGLVERLLAHIPLELRERVQWVLWRIELAKSDKDGQRKLTKVPYRARGDAKASSTNAATWSGFQEACSRYRAGGYHGIGFVFSENDPYTGIDLDHFRDAETGQLRDVAQAIVDTFASYAEWSPSGDGVHVLVKARLPRNGKRGDYEGYSSKRFFTVTGVQLEGTPDTIEERQEEAEAFGRHYLYPPTQQERRSAHQRGLAASPLGLSDDELLRKALRNARFAELWSGSTAGYASQSNADAALCGRLAFWTGRDAERMDRLFRASGLMREKWDERRGVQTYGERTLDYILSEPGESYDPNRNTRNAQRQRGRQARPAVGAGSGDRGVDHGGQADDADAAEGGAEDGDERIDAMERLMRIASRAQFFRTPGGALYAQAEVNGHIETFPINERGGSFRQWLLYMFRLEMGASPNADAMTRAMEALAAQARFEGERREMRVRVAPHDGGILLDLANDAWEYVQVRPGSWSIQSDLSEAPVMFRRGTGALALPTPTRGGDLDELRFLLNLSNGDDWRLLLAWLVTTLHPTGPYPILALSGERGTAKSTTSRLIRTLLDPATPATRDAPADPRNLAVAAHNVWVLALDNLSHIPLWLSDSLCRLATGAGFATRALYQDDGEVVFDAKRPILFNGIEDVATRGDLLDRAVMVSLPSISDKQRKTERDLNAVFEEAHPRLLGALLDVVASALERLPYVRQDKHPRMADFAEWVTAAESALGWESGAFMDVYTRNRAKAVAIAVEASPVVTAIVDLMEQYGRWHGTATELYAELKRIVERDDPDTLHSRSWPGSAQALTRSLNRISSELRAAGILLESQRTKRGAVISLSRLPNPSPDDTQEGDASADANADEKRATGDAMGDAIASPTPQFRHPDAIPSPIPSPAYASHHPDSGVLGDGMTQSHSSFSVPRGQGEREKRVSEKQEKRKEKRGLEKEGTNSVIASSVRLRTPLDATGSPVQVGGAAWMERPCPVTGGRHQLAEGRSASGVVCRACTPELVTIAAGGKE